ncbi:GMC oxidoreductase [Mycena galericulata]|nr:GMC oxidoreductase [Mycena galericulata]
MSPYPIHSIQDVSSKSYAFIVVGGGTAGCVLAARLSEDPKINVLLIERGPVVDGWAAGVPLLSSNFSDQKAPVYKWESAPLAAVHDKTLTMVTGKALGGSSKINGLLYTRSVPGEYNAWESAGRKGWGWEDVKPYFEKSETSASPASYRGSTGPWKTRHVHKIHFRPVASNIQVAPSFGIPYVDQPNDPASPVVSCTRLDATIDENGRRSATSDAFLPKKLVQHRQNLHICTGTVVTSLKIEDHKAVGVYIEADSGNRAAISQLYQVVAECGVVLCAGAISTPQILLLSGIGPQDHLMQHRIPVVKHLPGVGAHLQDHISVPVIYSVPVADSVEVLMKKPLTAVGQLLKYFFEGKGMFGTQVQQANIMLRSAGLLNTNSHVVAEETDLDGHNPLNIPDLEIMLIPVNPTSETFAGLMNSSGTFSYLCTMLRPKSHGSVRLVSTNARDQPLCDLGTLSHSDDRVPLRTVLRTALSLGRAVRASGYPLEDLLVPASESDSDLDRFTDENLTTTYHYSSSCRMAEEADLGVVDDQLRVHGISGLRIADASIFPQIPACHLQAPVVMVAERCAAFLEHDR